MTETPSGCRSYDGNRGWVEGVTLGSKFLVSTTNIKISVWTMAVGWKLWRWLLLSHETKKTPPVSWVKVLSLTPFNLGWRQTSPMWSEKHAGSMPKRNLDHIVVALNAKWSSGIPDIRPGNATMWLPVGSKDKLHLFDFVSKTVQRKGKWEYVNSFSLKLAFNIWPPQTPQSCRHKQWAPLYSYAFWILLYSLVFHPWSELTDE